MCRIKGKGRYYEITFDNGIVIKLEKKFKLNIPENHKRINMEIFGLTKTKKKIVSKKRINPNQLPDTVVEFVYVELKRKGKEDLRLKSIEFQVVAEKVANEIINRWKERYKHLHKGSKRRLRENFDRMRDTFAVELLRRFKGQGYPDEVLLGALLVIPTGNLYINLQSVEEDDKKAYPFLLEPSLKKTEEHHCKEFNNIVNIFVKEVFQQDLKA
jgi:hypothetical protein